MVLIELGQKINGALRTFHSHTMVGDAEIDQLLKDISNALMQADVNLKIVMKLRQDVKNRIQLLETQHNGTFNRRKMIQTCIFEAIQGMLDSGTAPYVPKKGKSNVIMFIGMQGAGKTTSCTKYAAYYQKRGFKVGLICADTFRAGAYDQLKQNATKARVRFYGNLLSSDPVTLAHEGVSTLKSEGYDLILVDTSGRHKQEEALFVEMQQIRDRVEPNDTVYVLDSTNGQTVQDQAQAFHSYVPVGSIILTKLDGHAKGGGALSAIAITKSPVIFIGTGEHYDEFEPFNPKSFVKRMLGFGDVEGLMNVIKGSGIDENSELYQRFAQGVFTLRDLYEHLENILKLGPVGKVMEMIPGLSMLKGREKESTAVLKIYLNILDSMSREELDAPNVKKVLTASRIQRIHRGSGRSIQEVHDLIKAYHKFEEMVKKMGKLNFQQLAKDPSALSMSSHTGQEQFTKLARAMDPNILKRLGGAGGLQSIMKQFNQLQ